MISPKIKNEMSQIINSQLSNNSHNANNIKINYNSNNINNNHNNRNYHASTFSSRDNKNYYSNNLKPNCDLLQKEAKLATNENNDNSNNEKLNTNNSLNFNKYDVANALKLGNSPVQNITKNEENYKINPPNNINYQSNFYGQNLHININYLNQSKTNNKVNFDSDAFYKKIKDNYNTYSNERNINLSARNLNIKPKDKTNNNVSNFQIFMTTSTPLNLETVLN